MGNYIKKSIVASNSAEYANCPTGYVVGKEKKRLLNDHALAGQAAHYLAEMFLKVKLGFEDKEAVQSDYEAFVQNGLHYSVTLENQMLKYVGACMTVLDFVKKNDGAVDILIEEPIKFGSWLPDKTGVVDFAVVSNRTLEIVDLKTGFGKVVANSNRQLYLYALGLMGRYNVGRNIDKICFTVVQPQFDKMIDRVEITPQELLQWGQEHRKMIMSMSLDRDENVPHCDVCDLGATCIHAAEYFVRKAGYIMSKPQEIHNVEEVGEILDFMKRYEKYMEVYREYWKDQAVEHKVKIPGYKAIHGARPRRYSNKKAVVDTIREVLGEDRLDELAPRVPLGIGAMSKALGDDFDKVLGVRGLVPYAQNGPRLVPEGDDGVALYMEMDIQKIIAS